MTKTFIIPIDPDPVLIKLEGQISIITTMENYAVLIEGREPNNRYQEEIDCLNFKIESHIAHKRNEKIKLLMNG